MPESVRTEKRIPGWVLSLCLFLIALCWSSRPLFAQGYVPDEAASKMTVAEGFVVELVASEPFIRQPVAIDFDDRGRLWGLQYLQYPNPAGLERVTVDRYSRTTYDRIPEPPPKGPKGADRLTILTDTDGDGVVDKSHDFLSDLNLATGFAFGRDGVFVLQTPYLLFYSDKNRDDIPDRAPDVLLSGFGMEDTSSLANSLVWGPDGWLYGTQGTNLTAKIRGIEFEQGIWRYHPERDKFELFAEGGSNMWGLDFDRHGNLLAGTNYGGFLMFHVVQGAYYQKSFAKHGELHNPFAFGYFEHVPHQNFQGGHVTVGGVVYQSHAYPPKYRDKYIAVDTLAHAVRWHTVTGDRSTFQSQNGGVLVQANDNWFAPSDATIGPDGAVYFADWHDQRTAHPDPDATWDRSNGRVFRLRWQDSPEYKHVDPRTLSTEQLIDSLTSENNWVTRRARRVLLDRRDPAAGELLQERLQGTTDLHDALQYLWALSAIGQFDETSATELLGRDDATLRTWSIRLLGDSEKVSDETLARLLEVARLENSPRVISQLASSAKRLPADQCLPLVRSIAERTEFQDDPHIPLLLWWAVEKQAMTHREEILQTFVTPQAWQTPLIRDVLLGRLMKRYAADGSTAGLESCARILDSAPEVVQQRRMIAELDAGLKLRGRAPQDGLPLGSSFSKIARKQIEVKSESAQSVEVPPALLQGLNPFWNNDASDPLLIRVMSRLGKGDALARADKLASARSNPETTRLAMLEILQELGEPSSAVTLGLKLLEQQESQAIQFAALDLLARFGATRITTQLLTRYPDMNDALKSRTRDVLLGRVESALAFLKEIDRGIYPPAELAADQLRLLAVHDDEKINALVRKHWGTIRAGTPEEKLAEIRRISNDLRAGPGTLSAGKEVFVKQCATCHKFFGEGKEVGPDLTKANRQDLEFLLASLVDPSVQIRKEYLSYVAVTNNGRVVTGLIIEETPASVTLVNAKNERTTLSRDNIEELSVSPVSLMPENVLKPFSPQQLRDLFHYLQHARE